MNPKLQKNLFNYIVVGAIIGLVLFIVVRHQLTGTEGIPEKAGAYLLWFQLIGAVVMFVFTGFAFYIFMLSLAIYRTKRFPPGGEIAGKRIAVVTGERARQRAQIGFGVSVLVFLAGCAASYFLFQYFQTLAGG